MTKRLLLLPFPQASATGRPGASYVDLPSNVLLQRLPQDGLDALLSTSLPPCAGEIHRGAPAPSDVASVASLLRSAQRPLLVVGKGAAMSPGCAEELRAVVNQLGIPVLATSMGRGLLPDAHPLCANAARSDALRGADVALIVGTRLNWQLHFGEAPKWAHGVKFALADVSPSARDRSLASATMVGDAASCLRLLRSELTAGGQGPVAAWGEWGMRLSRRAASAGASLARKLAAPPVCPLDYYTTLGVIRAALACLPGPPPLVVSEGANTMDMARLLLPVTAPRTRIDAGTWGTMGVGPGGAIAGGVCHPERLTLAIEGDSAFGFSGMEVETIVRYNLPVVLVVMNNGGIYGGDRRTASLTGAAAAGATRGGFGSDPAPTAFVTGARHDQVLAFPQ
jgi:2-hydroxyacyl-CoA lyase 1